MAPRKSARDHLDSGRQPHIVHMIPKGAPGFAEANGGAMVISSPAEVNGLICRIGPGEVITLTVLRMALARRHGVAVACPVSTAIFVNIAARAAEERRMTGELSESLPPWWRVLRPGGFLNPKLPGGVEKQAMLLQTDGVAISTVRKQLAVFDFEMRYPKALLER